MAHKRLALDIRVCAISELAISNPAAWSFFAATNLRAREVNAKSELSNGIPFKQVEASSVQSISVKSVAPRMQPAQFEKRFLLAYCIATNETSA